MKIVAKEIAITGLLVIFVFIFITVSLQNTIVVGPSMLPTIKDDQRIFVNKMVYLRFDRETVRKFLPWVDDSTNPVTFPFHAPRRGEIVVFHPPGQPDIEFIKRVIGLPGDKIEVRRGQVVLNGVTMEELYVVFKSFSNENRNQVTVPEGTFFVMGDNRSQSEDSRSFGPVPQINIIGKAWLTYWPRSEWRFIRSFNIDRVINASLTGALQFDEWVASRL
ncbi:MAG: signal peptidase I [Dehalococcoidia bacterium]|nr:signal peptidase I [Dehalococcoidia bacterium]